MRSLLWSVCVFVSKNASELKKRGEERIAGRDQHDHMRRYCLCLCV